MLKSEAEKYLQCDNWRVWKNPRKPDKKNNFKHEINRSELISTLQDKKKLVKSLNEQYWPVNKEYCEVARNPPSSYVFFNNEERYEKWEKKCRDYELRIRSLEQSINDLDQEIAQIERILAD